MTRSSAGGWRLVGLGALCGLAWGAALRAMMAEVAGPESTVSWSTFGWVILPAVLVGALLGWAEHLRRAGGRRGWRWLALAPLLFSGILFSRPTDMLSIFEDGLGAGAVGVPLLAMLAGWTLTGRGPLGWRVVGGAVTLGSLAVWLFSASSIDPGLAQDTPRGAYVTCLYFSLLALFALACAIPHCPVVDPTPVEPAATRRPQPTFAQITQPDSSHSESKLPLRSVT